MVSLHIAITNADFRPNEKSAAVKKSEGQPYCDYPSDKQPSGYRNNTTNVVVSIRLYNIFVSLILSDLRHFLQQSEQSVNFSLNRVQSRVYLALVGLFLHRVANAI